MTKDFNLSKETITLSEEMNGIAGEFYSIKDVKEFIKRLKDAIRSKPSWYESQVRAQIDFFAGEYLIKELNKLKEEK